MACLNCIRLREENEALAEEVRFLKDAMAPADIAHILADRFRLTVKESRLTAALVEHGFKTKQQLMDALYFGSEDEPELKIIDVFVCKTRKKLRPHGFDIDTVRGRGYSMSDAHRAELSTPKAA